MFQQQPGRDILNLAAAYSGIEFPHETAMHHAVDGVATHASMRTSTRPRRRKLPTRKFLVLKREYQPYNGRFLFV